MTCSTSTDAGRCIDGTLTVRFADGSPCADRDVLVQQVRHDFSFGNTGFDFVGLANGERDGSRENVFGGADPAAAERLEDLWLDLFNTATLPFYWAGFEPVQGRPDTRRLQAAAAWFRDRGVSVKGHPLVWHTLAPDWLREHPDADVEEIVRARVRREVASFAGLVDTWDAINEVVIMPVFANEDEQNAITRLCRHIGRIPTVRLAFEEARAANPATTLVLNDFNLSTAYECLVEGVLEAGVQVDAIGLQSHMHQGYWGEERTVEVLERFARYGLPLHWTETTLVSGDLMPPEIVDLNDHRVDEWPSTPEGEERQADDVVRHYRTLLSHLAVQAVTYWGITDRGAWLGAPSGLVRADGSPKPAYDALRGLVKGEWWLAPTRLRTDGEGRVSVRGWAGDYLVSAGDGSGSWALRRDQPLPEVTLA
ncbi:GH35 family endo-1,4-beta-xylanase [Geodermatophilus bullaregiensis]|uniref:endo-1,4-beta-xylanase n=1 Tax=Geodermatophilus bullaregiensis TaxID=1564160 RepID=UPI00195B2FFE|nr:endo-1,4-beta-xylanase [Geodermatophilus bullaregiensis]MBM7804523.1 GH35 family endo-1,4-beta-xylanase [Geodermatophilus bullaregiensis]